MDERARKQLEDVEEMIERACERYDDALAAFTGSVEECAGTMELAENALKLEVAIGSLRKEFEVKVRLLRYLGSD